MVDSIDLNRLKLGFPGLSAALGSALAEACIVCLENQKHSSDVEISIQGIESAQYTIVWDDIIDEQVKRAWNDLTIATEWAACGIAILVMDKLKGLVVVRQSLKGEGFDYWLGEINTETSLVQEKARLEVSGILRAKRVTQIHTRLKQKIKQIKSTKGTQQEFAIVVEFSRPSVWLEQK